MYNSEGSYYQCQQLLNDYIVKNPFAPSQHSTLNILFNIKI